MDSTREAGSTGAGSTRDSDSPTGDTGGRDGPSAEARGGGADDGPRAVRSSEASLPGADGPRFLQLADVAEVLAVSDTQVYALVRSGELRAIKLGGRGRWRVERTELQAYIDRMYDQTRAFIEAHPFARAELDAVEG